MTAIFSNLIRTQLVTTPTALDNATIRAYLYREAPSFDSNDARYVAKNTVAELTAMPGWVPATGTGLPLSNSITTGVRLQGVNHYVIFTQYLFVNIDPTEVKAVSFFLVGSLGGVTNPLLLTTDTPFSGQKVVVKNNDGVTAAPDSNLGGASNRWLFGWPTPGGGVTQVSIAEGALGMVLGPPAFETSHTQHVWLYPQRANLLANPSFEAPGTNFWAANGTISRIASPVPGGGSWAGQFAGGASTSVGNVLAVESNVFPTQNEERWTIQFMAKGVGDLKVGFVWWDSSFSETAVDWGTETWTLTPGAYIHIACCRTAFQTYQGMVRIEVKGNSLTIDQALVEKGYLKDWPYFDGDTTYGARDDFSWYGGLARQGASYSFWYNNKRAVFGELFSRDIDDATLITDEVMNEQGYVYQWVPAGTIVVPHMDVLYPNDLQAPVPPKSSTVVAWRTSSTDLLGMPFPWV